MFFTSLKIVKLIQTFTDAATYHLAGDLCERQSGLGSLVKGPVVCQLLESSPAVGPLYLGEDRFDGVELWAVTDVEDACNVKFFTYRFNVSRPVNRELVH